MTETTASPQPARPPRLLPGRSHDLTHTERVARSAEAARTAEASDGDLSFGDLIDIINPLQHLPIVGSIYRALTHDEISPVARVAGGLLFGGPIGAAAGVVGAIAEEVMGEDPGVAIAEQLFGTGTPAPTALADASPKATSEPAPATPTAAAATPPSGDKAIPQLSAAAFDALLQATGAVPEPAETATTASGATAAAPAGDRPGPRFFPAHATGPRAPRAVPLSLPAGVGNTDTGYDAAIQAMQRNLERYRGSATGPSAP